jgi:hypothetical protein
VELSAAQGIFNAAEHFANSDLHRERKCKKINIQAAKLAFML